MALRQALTGTIAARYAIERELGYGATSQVYLARDLANERRVAVKLLREEFAENIGADRFLREIRLIGTLDHPAIVGLLDSGVHEGRPFYVLPYMEGGTLRERLQAERQLPIQDVVAIGVRVAEALEFAHHRNVIHRDVKPENILFHDGKACLADFGIARAIERLTGDMTTSTGVVRGTPAYMSPEQAAGERDIDGRSDIYSLACVLYEALAGVPAFVGPTSQSVLQQRIVHQPRDVTVYRPTVPPSLERALNRALATVPGDRYATARELSEALTWKGDSPSAPSSAGPTTGFRASGRWVAIGTLAAGASMILIAALQLSSRSPYERGIEELYRFHLDAADAALATIRPDDADFTRAAIRMAQIRIWRKRAIPAGLTTILRRAQSSLANGDSLLVAATLAMNDSLFPQACDAYDALRRRDGLDVEAWIGLGNCQTRDRTLVADTRVVSGKRFRASYEGGIRAYTKAVEINPAVASLLIPGSSGAGPLLVTTGRLVLGRFPGDSTAYAAYPSVDLASDTLRLVPYEFRQLIAGASQAVMGVDARAIDRAVETHRRLWLRFARAWQSAAPNDPDAREALGNALELGGDLGTAKGDSSAFSIIGQARAISKDSTQKFRLSVTLVRLAIKQGDFGLAHDLADSLLRDADRQGGAFTATWAERLASLASLINRFDAAVRWSVVASEGASDRSRVPAPVQRELAELIAAASLGRCDAVPALLEKTEDAITRYVPPARVEEVWNSTLPRPLSLAAPCDSGRLLLRVRNPSDRLIQIQQAFASGRFASARRQLDTLRLLRQADRPGDIALDYTFQEGWLLAAMGDKASALERLTQTLASLPTIGMEFMGQPTQAAALCRSLDLAVSLSRATGRVAGPGWVRDRDRLCTG
jgi:tRNA A-37 threonylcarbamoyl transferase component Bud32/tetratricopeptide (TPR) repeat protein